MTAAKAKVISGELDLTQLRRIEIFHLLNVMRIGPAGNREMHTALIDCTSTASY